MTGRFEKTNHDAGNVIRIEIKACFQNLIFGKMEACGFAGGSTRGRGELRPRAGALPIL
jgi:hypothetical protein